jgi:Dna[CI] antecedent, DciA
MIGCARTRAPGAWCGVLGEWMKRVNEIVPAAIVDLLRGAPLSPGKVAFAWRVAVGPALERATSVTRQGPVLIVAVDSREWARELHRSSKMILARLERVLGEGVIASLDVRVGRRAAEHAPESRPESQVPNPKSRL